VDLHQELFMSKSMDSGQTLILNLMRTREHLSQLMNDRLFRAAGITDTQYNLLRILNGGPAIGYPIGEIRRRMVVRNADVPRLVDRLKDTGWVRRVPDPKDGRACRVQLTEEGRQKVGELYPKIQAFSRQLESAFSIPEQEQLHRLMDKLRETLRRELEGGLPTALKTAAFPDPRS